VPRFRVMVRCEAIEILVEDKLTEVGFFATRAVDADRREEAIARAIACVRADLKHRVTDAGGSVAVDVEEVTLVPWWWRRLRPPGGFTFFIVKPEDYDLAGQNNMPGQDDERS
jgi:hypothetical protein